MKADALLYTTSWCPYCRRAKALLEQKGVQWKELDMEADPVRRQAMMQASGRSSVPQILIKGMHVGGSDELFALMSQASSTRFSGARRLPASRRNHSRWSLDFRLAMN